MIGSGETPPIPDWQDADAPAAPRQRAAGARARPPPRLRQPHSLLPRRSPSRRATARTRRRSPHANVLLPHRRPSPRTSSPPRSVLRRSRRNRRLRSAPQQRPAGAPPSGSPAPATAPPARVEPKPAAPGTVQLTAAELRRVWPNVLDEAKRRRRFTHMLLSQHAQVVDLVDGVLTLGFSGPGPRENFGTGGSAEVLVEARSSRSSAWRCGSTRLSPRVRRPRPQPSAPPALRCAPRSPSPHPRRSPSPRRPRRRRRSPRRTRCWTPRTTRRNCWFSASGAEVIAVRDAE